MGSKPINSEDIIEVLGDLIRRSGPKAPIMVYIDERNSLAALSNVRGIIEKVGFFDVHYYCFTADREMMEEIIINRKPAMPFPQKVAFSKSLSQ